MSFIYQKNNFSDYMSQLIINNTQNFLSYPILIFYDQSLTQSYYYALLIKNKILLNNTQNVILVDLSTKNIEYSFLAQYLDSKKNPLNNFVIVDCLFDYAQLITILNEFINKLNQTQMEQQLLIPYFQIYMIVSCLNYYNINDLFLLTYYDFICLTTFINIYTQNDKSYIIDTESSYKNLNQLDLLKLIVNTNNFTISQYVEIKNVFFSQKQKLFYKIYFLQYKNTNAVNYINQWDKFDSSLIKFFNKIDLWENIINYNTITDAVYICNVVLKNNQIGYLIKIYNISYVYNYNNKIFIDTYNMANMKKQVLFIDSNITKTNDLSDTIYRINGTYFTLTYNIIFGQTYSRIYIKSQNVTNYIDIIDITNFYQQIDIYENNEHFKLIVFSNFKYDKIEQINNNMYFTDPLLTVQPMTNINNYYLFFLIISKHQFKLSRYVINNNNLILDNKMNINQYYNCAILDSEYLSDLFIQPIEIYYNKLD